MLLTDCRVLPPSAVKDQSTDMRLVVPLLEEKEQGRVMSSPLTALISDGAFTFMEDTEDSTGKRRRERERWRGRQSDRKKQAGRQADRQTDRQADVGRTTDS